MKAALILTQEDHDVSVPELDQQFGPRNWRIVTLEEAEQSISANSEIAEQVILLGVAEDNESLLERLENFIRRARYQKAPIVLIAADISLKSAHRLLQSGAQDFIPYPIPGDALNNVIDNLGTQQKNKTSGRKSELSGQLLSVFHFAGGAGATSFAVNLAWELTQAAPKSLDVSLIDLDFQYGGVSSFLDLPERPAMIELFTTPGMLEEATYQSTLIRYRKKLMVQTAPPEIVPLDAISNQDVDFVLGYLDRNFQFSVVDMPMALTRWSEAVLSRSHIIYCVMRPDVRDARNFMKFLDVLRDEGVPTAKIRVVMNHGPGSFDFGGRARIRKIEDSLGVKIRHLLPKGGDDVRRAADRGVPIADVTKRNQLRAAIVDIAERLLDSDQAAADPRPKVN